MPKPYYDPFELSDLLVRLDDLKIKEIEVDVNLKQVLQNNNCSWESILEELPKFNRMFPEFFTNLEDIPLYIGAETDSVTSIIVKWRFELGK